MGSRTRRARANLNRRSSAAPFVSSQRDQSADSAGPLSAKPYAHRTYSSPSFAHLTHDENRQQLFPRRAEHDDSDRPALSRPTSGRRLTYSSLPTTPIISSPPEIPGSSSFRYPTSSPAPLQEPFSQDEPLFSLWDYLREELLATDFESHQELKWDRVSNFLSIPLAMEKV